VALLHSRHHLAASRKVEELSRLTNNEIFAVCIPTKEIVARANAGDEIVTEMPLKAGQSTSASHHHIDGSNWTDGVEPLLAGRTAGHDQPVLTEGENRDGGFQIGSPRLGSISTLLPQRGGGESSNSEVSTRPIYRTLAQASRKTFS